MEAIVPVPWYAWVIVLAFIIWIIVCIYQAYLFVMAIYKWLSKTKGA